LKRVAGIVAERYHSTPGFARLIVDHLAGMSDRFALEEYRSLQLPSPDRDI
jgi:dGTP triphosphohydrolase